MTTPRLLLLAVSMAALAACSARIATEEGQQCSEELRIAEVELDKAKADGFGDAVAVTKAASLIAAAAFQKQFEKYEGCLDKAQRARAFLADVRKH